VSVKKDHELQKEEKADLPAFVGFTNVIYVAFAVIMILARHNGIHATSLALESCGNSGISSATFDLRKMRYIFCNMIYVKLTG
jgi:hypothetical protein